MTYRYQIIPTSQGGGAINLTTRQRVAKGLLGWDDYKAALTAGQVLPAGVDATQSLEAVQDQICADIDAHAAVLRNAAIAGHSPGEMAGWGIKLLDALAVVGNQPSPWAPLMPALQAALGLPSTPTSVCDAMGSLRGISAADYAAKILRDATASLVAEVALDAVRGARCDQVRAKTDVGSAVTFDWRAGWPDTGV